MLIVDWMFMCSCYRRKGYNYIFIGVLVVRKFLAVFDKICRIGTMATLAIWISSQTLKEAAKRFYAVASIVEMEKFRSSLQMS